MATSPVLLNKKPFDAEYDHMLQFTYSGSQIFASRLIAKDNATNEVVYDQKVSSMNTTYTIPAGTLTNGKTYNFQLSVFDHEDTESSLSSPIMLLCLKTPVFTFANVTPFMIVKNSYLDVTIIYEQENGELLNEYYIMLYAANKTSLVYTSDIQYADNLTVKIPELMDDTVYYIRATGSTVNGMEMDTGQIEFSCDYLKPDLFLHFRADNVPEEGSVKLSSNFVLVEGKTDSASLQFENGEKVNLLNGDKVWFDDGYVADNFTLNAIVEDIPDFATFMRFNMGTAIVELSWNYGYFDISDDKMYYVELAAYHMIGGEILRYIRTSNLIPALEDGQQVFIWMRHVNGLYDLQIEAIYDETAQTQTVIENSEDNTEGVEA